MKFLLFISFIILTSTQAQEHMLGGGTSSFLRITDSDTSFSGALAYDRTLDHGFQAGLDLGISINDRTKSYSILPNLTYNIFTSGESLNSAYFTKFYAGMILLRGTISDVSEFMYGVSLGKRFELAANISWSPGLLMLHTPGITSSDPTFSINLFRIDVTF